MFVIDPKSAVAPFEQLRSQVIAQVKSGHLVPGTRLPAVRKLATELGLAANTVARAYRELEAAGYVHTAGRNGTIVAAQTDSDDVSGEATRLAREYVLGMRGLGLDAEAMTTYLHRAAADTTDTA
ncbi:MAG: GntR family transcriptional regulator [Dermatophilus congolensis]|nr:GntR family transcriptional regulator [Dermatophilus congolensis]